MLRGNASTRSQAEDLIRRGFVSVHGSPVTKAGFLVDDKTPIVIAAKVSFVSRAGEKLYSVIHKLDLSFAGKVVLDVGSSTGGFTEVALREGAQKVIAVDVGTQQLHPYLRSNSQIELHEKTDIRAFHTKARIDMVVADVSFISLREILPSVAQLVHPAVPIVAMVKPQFEAAQSNLKHKGVIKNDAMRREILKDFESWARTAFVIVDKADSDVAGAKGNRERFYVLKRMS